MNFATLIWVLLPIMSARAVRLLLIFLLSGLSSMAQTESGIRQADKFNQTNLKENQILVGTSSLRTSSAQRLLTKPSNSISVSTSVLNEVGTAFTSLYNIQNQLLSLKVGNRNNKFLDFRSRIGAKGWEAKAVGSFSKKRPSTFDLNYRFSLEDMLVTGQGHRFMLITKF